MNQQSMTPTSSNPPIFPTTRQDNDSRQNRHQTYQPFAQDRAVSRIMQQLCGVQALQSGFEASSMSALAHLSDLAMAHMGEICRLTKLFCENTGRTIPVDKDVELALHYLNVPESELTYEISKLLENPNQPALQVRQSNPPVAPKILRIGDSNHRPSYIPNFLPPFPDPHTYIQTDVSCEPDVSYAKHREMCAIHQKNLDSSLIAFLATRYPTTSLFREFDKRLRQQAEKQIKGMESEEEEKMEVDPPSELSQNGTNHVENNGHTEKSTEKQQDIEEMFRLKPTVHSIVRQRLKPLYEILLPFEDSRPYLSALLPPEALDDLNL